MPSPIDLSSPVPRYHQIAEAIRERIEQGELGPGHSLSPLREAAELWGVNLHTVRHAYAELAREGLIESRRALGTRVTARAKRLQVSTDRSGREAFLARVAREAADRWGMSARDVSEALARLADDVAHQPQGSEAVYVVECSQRQCEDLAKQLAAAWDVDARPWCLDQDGEPPEGAVVATYFHFNELRLRWPQSLARVRFASIVVDPALARRVMKQAGSPPRSSGRRVLITLFEFDEPTLAAVAADLSTVLPAKQFNVRTRVIERASEAVSDKRKGISLVAPRVWGELTDKERASGRVMEARYVFEPDDLAAIGRQSNWTALWRR